MSLAMYKPEEGYWTRMMSALGWGLLVAWLATWLYGQALNFPVPLNEAGEPAVQQELVQGIAAGAALVIGGLLVYWLVYARRASSEFLIATDGEMKKVNWSTRREVMGSTWVVIGVALIMAFGLFLADLLFSMFFRWIGILQTG